VPNGLLDALRIGRELFEQIHRIIKPDNRGFGSLAHDGLRENDPGLEDGWQQRFNARAGLDHKNNGKRIASKSKCSIFCSAPLSKM